MLNCKLVRFGSCLLFLLWPWMALAQERAIQAPSQQAISFSADFYSRTIFKDSIRTAQSGKIYVSPPRIRFEPQPEEPEGSYNEYHLFDFGTQKMRRVFLDDRVYFPIDLAENNRLKAMQEGWIPWNDPPQIQRRKIKLKEELVNEHPCILYLQERRLESSKGEKSATPIREYSLVWEATDLKGLPVRIIYFPRSQSTVIVDYRNVKLADPDPALFEPPEGFTSLSPF